MNYKICTKCGKNKKNLEFNWRNAERGWRHGFCKQCHSAYRRDHYLSNRKKYLLKAKKWNQAQTLLLRDYILRFLSKHPCIDCGENDIRVLDFDHVGKKIMGIAQMIRNCHSLESVEREISNCKVRCANCHRIKTFVKGNFWKQKMGL